MKLLTESAMVGLRHCCFDQSLVMTLITNVAMTNYSSYLSYFYYGLYMRTLSFYSITSENIVAM